MKNNYDPELIGKRLREARQDKEWSLKELSLRLKLSDATLSRYENGEVAKIKTPVIQSLAEILGVEVDWILGLSDEKRKDDKIYSFSNNIPLIGYIAAGTPILAEENIEDYFSIDNSVSADFCLRVRGDSMIDEGILDGDIVFIKQQPVLENGEIGAVIINGEATLKRVYKNDNGLVLQPANTNYQPMVVTNGEVSIAGKLVAVLNLRT